MADLALEDRDLRRRSADAVDGQQEVSGVASLEVVDHLDSLREACADGTGGVIGAGERAEIERLLAAGS